MTRLDQVLETVLLSRESLETTMPGAFVNYDAIKKKSSVIALASDNGVIRKTKKRKPIKALYELLALDVWSQLLETYSEANRLKFRAPVPRGLHQIEGDNPDLFMSYLNGYELKKLGQLKRTTPVKIDGQEMPLPLFPACALYLGALNAIKEAEGLYHSDYDGRHIIFSPVSNRSIGVVDVENSRIDGVHIIQGESIASFLELRKYAGSSSDKAVLETWYNQGREELIIPNGEPQISRVLDMVRQKYNIDFDMANRKIEGVRLI